MKSSRVSSVQSLNVLLEQGEGHVPPLYMLIRTHQAGSFSLRQYASELR
ncbi:MAG: hypothetical protein AB8U44_03695 [Aaplasma endosymbiont of Hyalomma asiaticum]